MTRIMDDGACTVNTRKGGWGVVLQCPSAASGEIIAKNYQVGKRIRIDKLVDANNAGKIDKSSRCLCFNRKV